MPAWNREHHITQGVTIVAAVYGFVADDKREFDTRDVHRVQTNTVYVAKFVRQVGGDENKAYNMLVCCVYVGACVCVCVYVCISVCCVAMYITSCIGRSNEVEEVIWSGMSSLS